MPKKVFTVVMGLAGFLAMAGFVWLNFTHPRPKPQKVTVYMPPNNPELRGRIASVGVFKIEVSTEEFDRLAKASSYRALVGVPKIVSDDREAEFEYWLARGDGAFYHANTAVSAPRWGRGFIHFHTKWEHLGDRTWQAVPVWDSMMGWALSFLGLTVMLLSCILHRGVQSR